MSSNREKRSRDEDRKIDTDSFEPGFDTMSSYKNADRAENSIGVLSTHLRKVETENKERKRSEFGKNDYCICLTDYSSIYTGKCNYQLMTDVSC